ncbi:YHS domain-containing (seleno)protein [Flagellimonas myxillae]|uniref:YHS domain-containing (seleno)protein n=1 Tax=Flagellimonas myxillae TaxID=2942214 RepID=UPI00201EBBD5|nr:YHS domain-containing (seleno)protein [Muricauda myxillae]MCL6268246.1 YHS domain-containing protein [Muricauda myxillae]
MKNLVIILSFLFAATAQSQSKHINTKKGYAAQGYDVVAYFNGDAKVGNKRLVATHEGAEYKFATQENLDAFNDNPDKYVPQYGGYCAYAVALSGKKVNVDPMTFEIRDGKLYLFYNAGKTNTLELWLDGSPDKLKVKADKNWAKVLGK